MKTYSFIYLIILLTFFAGSVYPQQGPPPADPNTVQMVELDGHAVRVQAIGLDRRVEGEPVVVFEAGASMPLDTWSLVLPDIQKSAPVVTYDRAGLGQSEWDVEIPSPQHVAKRLHKILEKIGAGPPYVMVGYSWGGPLVRHFAGMFPTEVSGIVYVDPGPIVTQTVAENLAPFEESGAGKEGSEALLSQIEAVAKNAPPAVRAEFKMFTGMMEQEVTERGLLPVPKVPVTMIIAGKYETPPPFLNLPYDPEAHFEADLRHKIKMLSEWVLESPAGTLIVTNNSSHSTLLSQEPDLIIRAIQRMLATSVKEH